MMIEFTEKTRKILFGLIILFTVLVFWELIARAFFSPLSLPPPSRVFSIIANRYDIILYHTGVTFVEATVGFAIAFLVALPIAIFIGEFRSFSEGIYPWLVTLHVIPKLALAPLIFIWFGFSITTIYVIVALVCFFPMVVNTTRGFLMVPRDILDLMVSINASRWQIFAKVRFRYALPFLFVGMKISITTAIIGAVVGEWISSSAGIGYSILQNLYMLNTPMVFAFMIMLAVMGVGLYGIISLLERKISGKAELF